MSTRDDHDQSEQTLRAEKRLDEAIAALRAEGPSEQESSAALERVWARLESVAAPPQAGACDELRSQVDALVDTQLDEARSSLLLAHTRECLPCRRELESARRRRGEAGLPAALPDGGKPARSTWMRWAAAAAVLVTTVGLGSLLRERLLPVAPSASSPATLVELEGSLFSPSNGSVDTLSAGVELPLGQWLRTGKNARAVLELGDGSRVEMNERSQLLLRRSEDATTVQLGRGNVIVEAAKRPERNLFVETDELSVAVKGTIFTVGHGLEGSRVGVLEGSVLVDSGRNVSPLLTPGQQLASRSGLPDRALRDQVRWSRQFEQYRLLLDELEAVQASLSERPFEHRSRHSSALLDAMPPGTVFYAAIPNNSKNIRRFVELITERLDQSPELQDWWQRQHDHLRSQGQPTFDDMLDTVEDLSDALDEEVVVALVLSDDQARGPMPLIAARLKDEAELRRLVDAEIGERVRARGGRFLGIGDRATLEAAVGVEGSFHVASVEGTLLAGPSAQTLLSLADGLRSGATDFNAGSFNRALAQEYLRGAETLVAVDLSKLVEHGTALDFGGGGASLLDAAGLTGLEHFILRSTGDEPGAAVLSFNEQRRGLASWLAEPGPMGSLEFVSPQATLVISAVLKDPEAMLRDLQDLAGAEPFARAVEVFRTETGIDIAGDIAAPLGGEISLALDGPLFPTPAWKLILEVYEPARLQETLERLAAALAEASTPAPLSLATSQSAAGARHVLRIEGLPTQVHYAFVDGYLVAASTAHRLETTLKERKLGRSILSARDFTGALPQDGGQHLSLLAWQNLGPAIGLVLQGLGEQLQGAQRLPVLPLGASETACMLHARASEQDIAFSISANGMGVGAQIAAMLRSALVAGLGHAAEQGLIEAARRSSGYDDGSSSPERADETSAD